MDYLLSGAGGTENFSLQDMIECDIKSEFDDQLGLSNGHYNGTTEMDSCLAVGLTDDNLTGDLLNHNGPVNMDILSDINVSASGTFSTISNVSPAIDSKSDNNPSWLQSVNISALSTGNAVLQNCDSGVGEVLMVNPQTGVPVQIQTISAATSEALSPPMSSPISISSPSASIEQPASRVQFVTATIPSGTTLQQTLQGLQQQHIIRSSSGVQTIQNAQLITQALASKNGVNQALSLSRTQTTTQPLSSPSSLVTQQLLTTNNNHLKKPNKITDSSTTKVFPKPVYSYSCLIAMALKNSETGALPVSEIYSFMTENFPYFNTAPDGWKNSVRHNLSLNKCFEKIDNPKATGNTRKGCLWGLNPLKIEKMDEEIAKWRKKDLEAIQRSMAKPEVLEILEKGNISSHSSRHPNNVRTTQQTYTPSQPQSISPAIVSSNNVLTLATAAPVATPIQQTIAKSALGDIQLSMIEIKPAECSTIQTPVKIKVEPIVIKPESMDHSGAVGVPLTAEDLNLLDTSLSLDPALGDLAMQNGLWEELGADGGISLDDIALGSLGQGFTTSSSPLTVQATKTELSNASATSPLVSLLTSSVGANAKGASGSHTVTPSGGLAISRTIFAHM